MFMRTVQQNVFLVLNRVAVTFVTDPELIRPSTPVMTHSLDQKVITTKAKARKCTADNVGNIQAKVDR
jgi:SET domain-containing protein